MSDRLSNAAPVGGVGGFPNRPPHDQPKRQPLPEPQEKPAQDAVDLHGAAQVARRLLRERVLAGTRRQLELGDDEHVPVFAEVLEDEPISAFLGRLLGAQNLLAALRVNDLPATEIRRRLDLALREGTAEVLEMLAGDTRHGGTGAAVVAGVLAEYGERLARLAAEAERSD